MPLSDAIMAVSKGEDVPVENLTRAERETDDMVGQIREDLGAALPVVKEIDVVVTGSLARGEFTRGGDCDYLVLVSGTPNHDLITKFIAEMDRLIRELQLESPGQQGIFGDFAIATELFARIGLQTDSNVNTTRRLVLLTESRSTHNASARTEVIERIIERYCADYHPDNREGRDPFTLPRFLLNDVSRFWRTMTVDFGAKRWRSLKGEGSLRYAKLITTRKVLFAGTLMALFMTDRVTDLAKIPEPKERHQMLQRYLLSVCDSSPLTNLMRAHEYVDEPGREALGEVLKTYDATIGILGRPGARNALKNDTGSNRAEGLLVELDGVAVLLQAALEKLFFDDPIVLPMTRKYGIF
jgi:predicted nucleotidyltransferase